MSWLPLIIGVALIVIVIANHIWRGILTFIGFEQLGSHDCIIHCVSNAGKRYSFRGSSTVWRNMETGARCDTAREEWLSAIWNKKRWEMKR